MAQVRVVADISVNMFMDFLGYGNHVELYSEEISRGGEGLGVSRVIRG